MFAFVELLDLLTGFEEFNIQSLTMVSEIDLGRVFIGHACHGCFVQRHHKVLLYKVLHFQETFNNRVHVLS